MSMYLQNLATDIDATISRSMITFRKGSRVVDMVCCKRPKGFDMVFHLGGDVTTTVKAESGQELADKLSSEINGIFNGFTLKGMI